MVKALVDEPLALTTAFKVAVDAVTDVAGSVLAVGGCAKVVNDSIRPFAVPAMLVADTR